MMVSLLLHSVVYFLCFSFFIHQSSCFSSGHEVLENVVDVSNSLELNDIMDGHKMKNFPLLFPKTEFINLSFMQCTKSWKLGENVSWGTLNARIVCGDSTRLNRIGICGNDIVGHNNYNYCEQQIEQPTWCADKTFFYVPCNSIQSISNKTLSQFKQDKHTEHMHQENTTNPQGLQAPINIVSRAKRGPIQKLFSIPTIHIKKDVQKLLTKNNESTANIKKDVQKVLRKNKFAVENRRIKSRNHISLDNIHDTQSSSSFKVHKEYTHFKIQEFLKNIEKYQGPHFNIEELLKNMEKHQRPEDQHDNNIQRQKVLLTGYQQILERIPIKNASLKSKKIIQKSKMNETHLKIQNMEHPLLNMKELFNNIKKYQRPEYQDDSNIQRQKILLFPGYQPILERKQIKNASLKSKKIIQKSKMNETHLKIQNMKHPHLNMKELFNNTKKYQRPEYQDDSNIQRQKIFLFPGYQPILERKQIKNASLKSKKIIQKFKMNVDKFAKNKLSPNSQINFDHETMVSVQSKPDSQIKHQKNLNERHSISKTLVNGKRTENTKKQYMSTKKMGIQPLQTLPVGEGNINTLKVNLKKILINSKNDELNECRCNNGIGTIGNECPNNGEERCTSCNSGYHLDDDLFCQTNNCFCPRGISATGEDCSQHGFIKCVSCESGFLLDTDQQFCVAASDRHRFTFFQIISHKWQAFANISFYLWFIGGCLCLFFTACLYFCESFNIRCAEWMIKYIERYTAN